MPNSYEQVNDSLRLENITAVPAFNELVELASAVCLKEPSRVQEYYHHNRVIHANTPPPPNVWATQAAHVIASDGFRIKLSDDSYDPIRQLNPDTALTLPEQFGPQPIAEVLDLANAFGEALLDESFECLGDDAPLMVKNWHENPAKESRVEVLVWLNRRINEIRENHQSSNPDEPELIELLEDDSIIVRVGTPIHFTTEELARLPIISIEELNQQFDIESAQRIRSNPAFYHPARLSPKLLGKYPDTKLEPTCLAVSMLATSFMRKLGLPILHAGVMRTASHEAKRAMAITSAALLDYADKYGIDLPDLTLANVETNQYSYDNFRDRQNGYHAATLLQFNENFWFLMDPNFETTNFYSGSNAKRLTARHQILNSQDYQMDGVNLIFNDYLSDECTVYADILNEAAKETVKPPETTEFLDRLMEQSDPIGFLRDYVRNAILADKTENKNSDAEAEPTLKVFLKLHLMQVASFESKDDQDRDHVKENLEQLVDDNIDEIIDACIAQYAFPDIKDNDLSYSFQKCRTDPHYRRRREDDLSVLPLMVIMRIQSNVANDIINNRFQTSHSYLEVGQAASRIGLCVLSDFAVMCGDELPATFWTSQWSSGIAWREHAEPNIKNVYQYKVARNIAKFMNTSSLTYAKDGGMIDEFLKQGANYPRG